MATAIAKSTNRKVVAVVAPVKDATIQLTPAIQKQVRNLRASRDAEKLAKESADLSRVAILEVFAGITQNTIGVDAKGKRLVAVKLIDSPEKIDWKELEKRDPEVYSTIRTLLAPYITPKGAGDPTIRVDCI
jgi:hypothetical protein